eukprot:1570043-Pleurochrysis_carterae.AAC.1
MVSTYTLRLHVRPLPKTLAARRRLLTQSGKFTSTWLWGGGGLPSATAAAAVSKGRRREDLLLAAPSSQAVTD